jgi:hypothetical protein
MNRGLTYALCLRTQSDAKIRMDDDHFADLLEQSAIKNAEFLASIPQGERRHHIRRAMKSAEVVYAIWYNGDERAWTGRAQARATGRVSAQGG